MKKICVVTGTRADYGLLRWVMHEIASAPGLQLQVAVTGAHLSPEFGLTWRNIVDDGFAIDAKVEMLLGSDTPVGITKSLGLAVAGFADALAALRPDLLLVLGDRYEIFGAVTAATMARIPVAHLHGGEVTEGAFDDAMRHAITKMSHLHFVAAEDYRRRVLQLGEAPEHVHNVGGLGIDNILRLKLLERAELEQSLDFKLGPRNLLVTFHPVTLEPGASAAQMEELLAALDSLPDTKLLFTMPNADTENRQISEILHAFAARHPDTAKVWTSLGQLRYLSCLRHVDGVVGNSSSGLTEAPSFHIGTVNIGERQHGRLKAASVIDCAPARQDIARALQQVFSGEFRARLPQVSNPYGKGGAAVKVAAILSACEPGTLLKKKFYDLPAIRLTPQP
jgi:GDP/UDP-N,N'-diacetylbacillosamine 2-epimerase (hydrolysing)